MSEQNKNVNFKPEYREPEHLLQSVVLEETGSPRLIVMSAVTTLFIFFMIVLWAAVSKIDEIIAAQGVVAPEAKIQIIRHLEGGIVQDVVVKEGQHVKENEPLVKLSLEAAQSEKLRLQGRDNYTSIDIARLTAYSESKFLKYEDFDSVIQYKDLMNNEFGKKLIFNAVEFLQQMMISRTNQKNLIVSKVDLIKNDIKTLEEVVVNLNQHLDILKEQKQMFEELQSQQAVSKLTFLDSDERSKKTNGDLVKAMGMLESKRNDLISETQKLSAFDSNDNEKTLKDIADLNAFLIESRDLLDRAKDTVNRFNIVSPVNGIVKGIEVTAGSVVAPGGKLMEVVPSGDELIVEAQVVTKDIGHLKIEDPVQVKIDTYNYVTYGSIPGLIKSISASTFMTPDGKPFFKIQIKLKKNYLGKDPNMNQIMPGMTVTADIVTDKRSLLATFLSPFQSAFDRAFTER